MSQSFLQFAARLHSLTMALCMACLMVVLVSMSSTVMLRHGAGIGFLQLQDLTLYAFGLFAVLSIPCALAQARHVKVHPTGRQAGRSDGTRVSMVALLLVGLLAMTLLFYGWPLFVQSLLMGEGSGQIGGLPGFFVVKAALPLGAGLILIQGVALWMRGGGAVR